MKKSNINRREFIRNSAASAAALGQSWIIQYYIPGCLV